MRYAVAGAALSVLGLAALAGCGNLGSSYLQAALGQATEQDIRRDLGRPDQMAQKDAGQLLWMYQSCPPPQACYVWYLTFDRDHVLRAWERAPEQL